MQKGKMPAKLGKKHNFIDVVDEDIPVSLLKETMKTTGTEIDFEKSI